VSKKKKGQVCEIPDAETEYNNGTGEPCALKGARTVRRGEVGKGVLNTKW
jgi:hypothetical protein